MKKIYYHDTDSGGVVYYANYLKYFEEARTEYFAERGVDVKALSGQGILFAVKRVEIDYKAAARYGDTLTLRSEITKLKNASLEFFQEAERNGEVLTVAKTVIVCIGSDFRPQGLPAAVSEKLKR